MNKCKPTLIKRYTGNFTATLSIATFVKLWNYTFSKWYGICTIKYPAVNHFNLNYQNRKI